MAVMAASTASPNRPSSARRWLSTSRACRSRWRSLSRSKMTQSSYHPASSSIAAGLKFCSEKSSRLAVPSMSLLAHSSRAKTSTDVPRVTARVCRSASSRRIPDDLRRQSAVRRFPAARSSFTAGHSVPATFRRLTARPLRRATNTRSFSLPSGTWIRRSSSITNGPSSRHTAWLRGGSARSEPATTPLSPITPRFACTVSSQVEKQTLRGSTSCGTSGIAGRNEQSGTLNSTPRVPTTCVDTPLRSRCQAHGRSRETTSILPESRNGCPGTAS